MAVLKPFSIVYKLIYAVYIINVRIINLVTFKRGFVQILWEIILFLTRNTKTRLPEYRSTESGDLEENALKVPTSQRDLEYRRSIKQDESDTILIYGCHAQKQRLLVRVTVCGQVSLATLFMRLENGKSYSLPKIQVTNLPRTTLDCFVGNGLKIRCLVPMRKWRVSYAGLLEETSENGEKRLVNVKLGLYWTCSSTIHDLQSDISNAELAEFFGNQKRFQPWPPKVHFIQNSYVQAGNLIGSVSIEGQEERVAVIGAAIYRKRH